MRLQAGFGLRVHSLTLLFGAMAIVAVACSSSDADSPTVPASSTPEAQPSATPAPSPTPVVEAPEFTSDPFEGLSPLPEIRAVDRSIDFGFDEHEAIPRDAINPVYTPKFVGPSELEMLDGELVMGLHINGESRAYPIGIMRFREMVNDVVGGVPLLVTC